MHAPSLTAHTCIRMCMDALGSYYFTASASNAVGMSRVSEPVVFYTQASVPSAPVLPVGPPTGRRCAAPSPTHSRMAETSDSCVQPMERMADRIVLVWNEPESNGEHVSG